MRPDNRQISITCATDSELVSMYDQPKYTSHYKARIWDELSRRGIELSQQLTQLPNYATQLV